MNNQPVCYAMQAIGEYKESDKGSSIKQRDYKDCTDLVIGSFYPQMKAESQCWREDDKANTLVNGTNPGYQNGVCIAIDRASFNQGENAQFDFSVQEDVAQTIVSKGPGGGTNETVGALCARDYKGVGKQYVEEGKCIIQPYRRDDTKG